MLRHHVKILLSILYNICSSQQSQRSVRDVIKTRSFALVDRKHAMTDTKCSSQVSSIFHWQAEVAFIDSVHKFSTDDSLLWEFFKKCARREEILYQRNQALTHQINKQNANQHDLNMQYTQFQNDLNAAIDRYQKLEVLYVDCQRFYVDLENQIQKEKQQHRDTRETLEVEMREHAKTEKNLERYWSTLKGLSEFLAMVQVSFSENKIVVMTRLMNDQDLGVLISDIENKQEYLEDYKERIEAEVAALIEDLEHHEQQHEGSMQARQPSIAELGDREPDEDIKYEEDQEMAEVKQDSLIKRRFRSNRKSSKNVFMRRG